MLTISFLHEFFGNSANITHWDICADGAIILSGNNTESLIEALQGIQGIVFCYDLSTLAPFLHWHCVNYKIDYDCFENKGVYYSFYIEKCAIKGATNFFNFPEPKTVQYLESEINFRFNLLKSYLIECGSIYTAASMQKKCTIGGIAWSCFKELSRMESVCPKIYGKMYNILLPYYRGGFVYAKRGEYKNINEIDNNGLYTHVYKNYTMPIGKPVFCKTIEELDRFPFRLYHITGDFKLKSGYIPIIAERNNALSIDTVYLKEGHQTLFLTQYDLELVQEFYDIEFEFVNGYGFRTKEGLFDKYSDFWLSKKKHDALRKTIKFMLNIPSGKAATRGTYKKLHYEIDKAGILQKNIKEIQDNIGGYEYIPLAIAITSIARYILLNTAKRIGFDRVYYMDTDSIKFSGDIPDWIDIDQDRCGAWKIERFSKILKILGKKCYITYSDLGEIKAVVAGVTDEAIKYYGYYGKMSENGARELIRDFNEQKEIEQKERTPCCGGIHDFPYKRYLSSI